MAKKMKQARFDLHPCLLEIEGGDADAVAAVEGDNTGSPGCRAILECHRWSGDCIFPRRAGLSEIDVYIPNVLSGAISNTMADVFSSEKRSEVMYQPILAPKQTQCQLLARALARPLQRSRFRHFCAFVLVQVDWLSA